MPRPPPGNTLRDGIDGDRVVRSYDAVFDKRPDERDRARRVAAGIGNAMAPGLDGVRLCRSELGKAYRPNRAQHDAPSTRR